MRGEKVNRWEVICALNHPLYGRVTTYIDMNARVCEDSSVWGVSGDVSVELLTIPVPLHTVQLVPLHVIVTHQ